MALAAPTSAAGLAAQRVADFLRQGFVVLGSCGAHGGEKRVLKKGENQNINIIFEAEGEIYKNEE